MSADLFAEFNELSKSPAPASHPSFDHTPNQNQTQYTTNSQGPFDLLQKNSSGSYGGSQTEQQWSSFAGPPQSSALGAWGDSSFSSVPQASTTSTAAVDDDDDWGDFETSGPAVSQLPQPQEPQQRQMPKSSIQWQSSAAVTASQGPPQPGLVRASTLDLMTNNLIHTENVVRPAPAPSIREEQRSAPSRPRLKQQPSDPNVLFDAGDFELEGGGDDYGEDDEDDDFGDFETVAPASSRAAAPPGPATKPAPPSLDLLDLSLDDSAATSNATASKSSPVQASAPGLLDLNFGATIGDYPMAPKSPSFQKRNPFPELAVKTPIATGFEKQDTLRSASPVTAWPSFEAPEPANKGKYQDDEDWGAWDEMPSATNKASPKVSTSNAAESWDWDAVDHVQSPPAKIADDAAPPVNVPPPSVILSIFPDLLGSANQLFKPMAGQSASIKARISSDPRTLDFLEGYILLATTAAHVIAGRKQRWHRDKILAKSMSISAAGSKGMKLAGVDKTQSAREDREAADVVAVWRDNVGRLRSAVAAAKAAGKVNLKVPELNETMPIQTAKQAPTAPKPCVICGLKRDERVGKVDHEVEDSFGEWWVEHWGHRACKNFWIEHEQKLRQR